MITEGAAHVLRHQVTPFSQSLYKDYTDFLKENITLCNERKDVSAALLKNGIKGFISNRFGRLVYLSKAVVEHKEMLEMFFDRQVDRYSCKQTGHSVGCISSKFLVFTMQYDCMYFL